MTKEEVKEEYKDRGNPQTKSRIARVKMSRMHDAAVAGRLFTNPTHYAVALSYKEEAQRPVVVARAKTTGAKIRTGARVLGGNSGKQASGPGAVLLL